MSHASQEDGDALEGPATAIAQACLGVLDTADCCDLATMEVEDALGYAFTLLIEHGVEDPAAFLREQEVLE